MMHNRPAKTKPLIDLTKTNSKEEIAELKAEVRKLTSTVQTLTLQVSNDTTRN